MNPIDVLAPNNLGNLLDNLGVGELVRNQGLGVAEALGVNPQARAQRDEANNPQIGDRMNKMRVAKARQFGMKKTEVGF